MIQNQRVVVVLPAYNASETLERTLSDLDSSVVDHVILTDDASMDETAIVARRLGLDTLVHDRNRGYGGNQKTCYRAALERDADIVVMVHPDYQYSPRLVPAMASMVASGHYDFVLGSRILGGRARSGGMPLYKYIANRMLTAVENLLCGSKLSEMHTGLRAYSRELLETLPFDDNSDDFVFDNQLIVQSLWYGFRIGEISCPTRYLPEASSIGPWRSVVYGLGCLRCALGYRLARWGLVRQRLFPEPARPTRSD